MKIDNFQLMLVKERSILATVDVTTRFLWFKPDVETRQIVWMGAFWHWRATGEYTPMGVIEALERKYLIDYEVTNLKDIKP